MSKSTYRILRMVILRLSIVLCIIQLLQTTQINAQTLPLPYSLTEQYFVYEFGNKIYVQNINENQAFSLGDYSFASKTALPNTLHDVYLPQESSIPSSSGFQFQHGVFSSDRSKYAHVELELGGLGYQIHITENGSSRLLDSGVTELENGYPDPIGWTTDGQLLLNYRMTSKALTDPRIWIVNVLTGEKSLYAEVLISALHGESVSTPDGQAIFIGVDVEGRKGYLFNIQTKTLSEFTLDLILPSIAPVDRFGKENFSDEEQVNDPLVNYRVTTIGMLSGSELQIFAQNLQNISARNDSTERTATGFGNPVPSNFVITQGFGAYYSPYGKYHGGEDWTLVSSGCPVSGGQPVFATAEGVVVFDNNPVTVNYPGHVIVIRHTLPDNSIIYSQYGHLETVEVSKGQTVAKGQKIATIYNWPLRCNSNAHLHFEIRTQERPYGTFWGPGYYGSEGPAYGGYLNPTEFINNHQGSPLISAEKDIVINGTFDNDMDYWTKWGCINWNITTINENPALAFYGRSDCNSGALQQVYPYSTVSKGSIEVSFYLGNNGLTVKEPDVVFRNQGQQWNNAIGCYDFTVPPKTPLKHFVVRGKPSDWASVVFSIYANPHDAISGYLLDDVRIRWYKDLNVEKTECYAPSNVTFWDFRNGQGLQGWSANHHLENVQQLPNGRGIYFHVVGGSSAIHSPGIEGVNVNDYGFVRIDMASSTDSKGILFPKYEPHRSFAGGIELTIIPDGKTRTYYLPMRDLEHWRDIQLSQLRLYPADAPVNGMDNGISLEYIELTNTIPLTILNNGFETVETETNIPTGWQLKKPTSDKRKCNKNGKIFAHSGKCAFQFKGDPGKSSLQQSVNPAVLRKGDKLALSAWFNVKIQQGGKLQAKIKYVDGTKDKINVAIPNKGNKQYVLASDESIISGAVRSLKVVVSMTNGNGKFLIDDVNLTLTSNSARAASSVISLPANGQINDTLMPIPLP